ncbi:uncharacterized protein RCC_09820 [Ramularia collo-cygni]|uniref:Uncharacterized protein n=1 Tax=Ramularia collo-cygni TaxID=112498 RepID=A0A2D3V7X9_9PEZI|nr:uncharacterized protein RCC_09820 [Ramularia collo-cygni]CZT24103.1 uncharacterized protein RCC_09820 [Ramularia collo-cygni]
MVFSTSRRLLTRHGSCTLYLMRFNMGRYKSMRPLRQRATPLIPTTIRIIAVVSLQTLATGSNVNDTHTGTWLQSDTCHFFILSWFPRLFRHQYVRT